MRRREVVVHQPTGALTGQVICPTMRLRPMHVLSPLCDPLCVDKPLSVPFHAVHVALTSRLTRLLRHLRGKHSGKRRISFVSCYDMLLPTALLWAARHVFDE